MKRSTARPRRRSAGATKSATANAGYSGTPLIKKLGIVAGGRVHAVGAPRNYRALLGPIPAGVRFVRGLTPDTDLVHAFVRRRRELEELLSRLRRELGSEAVVWISWPKRASGVETDVTEDTVRELGLPLGFVDVKVCAVDAVWSALKLVVRRELR